MLSHTSLTPTSAIFVISLLFSIVMEAKEAGGHIPKITFLVHDAAKY